MPLNVGTQRQIVLSRSRDPNGTANTATLVWDLFNRLQWAVNAEIEDVVQSAALSLNSRQCLYAINANLPNAQKIIGIRNAKRDLYPVQFDQLRGIDRYWFRRFRDDVHWFALCGYDLLVIGPPPDTLQEATSVEVRYNAVTTPITSDASTFQLQDENVESVMELTEAILLAKARDWAGAQEALQRAVKSLKLEGLALRDMVPVVPPTTDVSE
jgi:hypothetical protein